MRLPALVAVSLLAALPAFAQQASVDQQRRKIALPFIRAATDCVAQVVATNPIAARAVTDGRGLDLMRTSYATCRAEIDRVERVHDEMHGSGTGKSFLLTAYANDLPRAVTA